MQDSRLNSTSSLTWSLHALALGLMLTPLVGCGGCGGKDKAKNDGVVVLDQADTEIAAARAQARQTVGQFLQVLAAPTATQTNFAIKVRFEEGEQVEFMWLTELRLEQGMLLGRVNNQPTLLQNVRQGDTFSVSPMQIDDWMYVDNQQMIGGYSIAVLRKRQQEQVAGKEQDHR